MAIEAKDPRDLDGRMMGLKVPHWMREGLDDASARLGYRSRNALVLEIYREFLREHPAPKDTKAKAK